MANDGRERRDGAGSAGHGGSGEGGRDEGRSATRSSGAPPDAARINRLVAVIDGSVYSESVCDHAAWFARRARAEVDVVHVIGRRHGLGEPSNLSGSIGLGARSALLGELAELDAQRAKLGQKRGRAILLDAETRLTAAGIEKVRTRLRHGEIVETVQTLEQEADLLVMGKRGEAADFDTMHLGSNLERVIRSTHKPVLVAARAFRDVERFLLAFDGGPSAMKAVDFIAARPHYDDLACHLVTVGTDNAETRRSLEGAAATLRDAGFTVEIELRSGQPETAIAQAVEELGIDLLIIGAYGHSRIRNLIIGSTTSVLLTRCKVPVLLFR